MRADTDTPQSGHGTTSAERASGVSTDVLSVRQREGLPDDAVIVAAPGHTTPPMRMPAQVWAMVVVAVHIHAGGDDVDPVGLFAGCWRTGQDPAGMVEGDVVLRLHHPAARLRMEPDDPATVDVELLLAHQDRWDMVGLWPGLGMDWPGYVARTAAAIMGLHTSVLESCPPACVSGLARTDGLAAGVPPVGVRRGGLSDLLAAGLVEVGDELVWDRRNKGLRHTARVCADGRLELADGGTYANPSGALRALGRPNTSGWKLWRRVRDNRTLGELRAQLRARQ